MKQPSLIIYLSIPAVFTLGVFAVAGRREPFGVGMFSAYVIESYLFYAAPYLVWTVVTTLAKASRPVWHAGFIASFIALMAIGVMFGRRAIKGSCGGLNQGNCVCVTKCEKRKKMEAEGQV